MAEYKGFSKRAWFHTCFWLPVFGYFMLLVMPDLELRKQNKEIIELQKQLLIEAKISNHVSVEKDEDVPDPFAK